MQAKQVRIVIGPIFVCFMVTSTSQNFDQKTIEIGHCRSCNFGGPWPPLLDL